MLHDLRVYRSICKNQISPLFWWFDWWLNLTNHSCVCVFHRYVFPSTQAPHNGAVSATAADGSNGNPTQSDTLMQENMRLRKELEVYVEKATRLQRVSEGAGTTVIRKTIKVKANGLVLANPEEQEFCLSLEILPEAR